MADPVVFVRVDPELHRLVRLCAASEHRSIQDVGADALREYVYAALNISDGYVSLAVGEPTGTAASAVTRSPTAEAAVHRSETDGEGS